MTSRDDNCVGAIVKIVFNNLYDHLTAHCHSIYDFVIDRSPYSAEHSCDWSHDKPYRGRNGNIRPGRVGRTYAGSHKNYNPVHIIICYGWDFKSHTFKNHLSFTRFSLVHPKKKKRTLFLRAYHFEFGCMKIGKLGVF